MDKGLLIGTVFVHPRKAFETINRHKLIKKLRNYGLENSVLNWFKSYLSDRKQKVKIGNITSDDEEVKFGVPQGSILGPLLFLIYINDVTDIFKDLGVKCKLFADDMKLYFSSNNISFIEIILNKALERLSHWLDGNQMKINIDETVFMLLHDRRTKSMKGKCEIVMNGNIIKEVNESKYLGVIMDNNLIFDSNAIYVAKKVAKKINVLFRLNHTVSNYTKSIIYKTIVAPHFEYCGTIMVNYSQNRLDVLQKLQNRAMRVILEVNRNTPIIDMLHALGWMSIKQRMMFNTCILIYKMINNLSPSYLCDRIKLNNERTRYYTRNSTQIDIKNTKTHTAEKSITYVGYNWYNKLTAEVKNQSTLASFKRELSKYIKRDIAI